MWYLFALTAATTVYFVPHSHIDVGWIDVTDVYYYEHGLKIMETMLTLLEEKPDRKFCWSEAFFFYHWINDYPSYKPRLRKLIENGQLEIAGGGWVMNDEALTDFEMVARQIETGHNFFTEELGSGPIKVAWQLDPFGHSSLTPALFEKLGFEYLIMSRIDDNYKTQLMNTQNMEFLWKSNALGSKTGLFTHLLHAHYGMPPFLSEREYSKCFSSLQNSKNEIESCVRALENYVDKMSSAYKTENLLILYGDDISFKYLDESRLQYELLEALRDNSQRIKVKIANPSEYFKAVLQENKHFEVFEGDLLPYVSEKIRGRPLSWTGFYSSRPALKKKVYELHSLVRSTELLTGLLDFGDFNAYQASVLLHHDAITGTCQPVTAKDYFARIEEDEKKCITKIEEVYKKIIGNKDEPYQISNPYKVFIFFNSLSWKVKKVAKIPIDNEFASVFVEGETIISQIIEIDKKRFVVFVLNIKAYSFFTVFISEFSWNCNNCGFPSTLTTKDEVDCGKFTFSMKNGLLNKVAFDGEVIDVNSRYVKYTVQEGGAYEFRPTQEASVIGEPKHYSVQKGLIFTCIYSVFSYYGREFAQTILVPKYFDYFYLTIKSLSQSREELFFRMENKQNDEGYLYTFNSVDFIKRFRYEKRYNCYGENSFPAVGGLFVDYSKTFLHVYPKSPLGVYHPAQDYYELHLHRNPPDDDVLGLGSPLLDREEVESEFLITVGSLNISKIWKNYLNFKHSPIALTLDKDFNLTLDLKKALNIDAPWEAKTEYKILEEDPCVYLSRLFYTKENRVVSIMNVCDNDSEFDFKGFQAKEEVQANGYPISEETLEVNTEGSITFDINKNIPDNMWRYYDSYTEHLSPFHLYSYIIGNTVQVEQIMTFMGVENILVRGEAKGKKNNLLVPVLILFGISVAFVFLFSLFKLRGSKKLD